MPKYPIAPAEPQNGAQIGPDAKKEFMRMRYNDKVIEHKYNQEMLMNFFQPEVEESWMSDFAHTHSIRVTMENYLNPFDRPGVKKIRYKEGEECPKRLDLGCDEPPIGPVTTYTTFDVFFDKEYTIAASECIKTRKLTLNELAKEWQKDMDAKTFRRGVDAWNELAGQIAAAPVTTKLPGFTKYFANNNLQGADTDPYTTLTKVFTYMDQLFQGFSERFIITMHHTVAEKILLNSAKILAYDQTGIPQTWRREDITSLGSFKRLPQILGWSDFPILVAPTMLAFYHGNQNYNPWESDDGSKARVIIASKRSFYTRTVPLHDKFVRQKSTTVDIVYQTWLAADKLLIPEETFIIEFNNPNHNG